MDEIRGKAVRYAQIGVLFPEEDSGGHRIGCILSTAGKKPRIINRNWKITPKTAPDSFSLTVLHKGHFQAQVIHWAGRGSSHRLRLWGLFFIIGILLTRGSSPFIFMSGEIAFQTKIILKRTVFLLFSIQKMDFSEVMNLFNITSIHPLPGYHRIGRAPYCCPSVKLLFSVLKDRWFAPCTEKPSLWQK